jgi:hypothetical protein
MSDSPQDKGGPDPSNDANSYWQNLLGFPIDPWLGISDSALKECYGALGVVSARWNRSEALIRFFTAHYAGITEKTFTHPEVPLSLTQSALHALCITRLG